MALSARSAAHVRQVPDEVRLDDVRLGIVVAEQTIGFGLIASDRQRPVGGVLQPRRRVLAIVEPDGVVEPEREAVAEPPLQRELHRVIRPSSQPEVCVIELYPRNARIRSCATAVAPGVALAASVGS